jgi:hypothetical protein
MPRWPSQSGKGQKKSTTKHAPAPTVTSTENDPSLNDVIKRITDKYHALDSPFHRANYLRSLYAALYDIDREEEEDS